MKIIRLSTFLDFGGIESKMTNLSSFNDANEIIFCAIGKGGIAEKNILKNKKEVICFELPHQIPSFKTILKLYKFFKQRKPDVVHCSGAEANFHGVIAAKLANVRVIISEEIGISSQSKKAKLIFNFVYKLSDFVLGESKNVIDHLKINYKIKNEKLKVVQNFTLFTKFENNVEKSKNFFLNIVSVSRLEPVKNIEGIINTLFRLKSENYKFKYRIVGDGSLKENLTDLIDKLSLENEIELIGFQANPVDCYLKSDLFLLNSRTEGFSNSLLEAMYFKKIVISTDVGNAKEMIENGKNGFIIEKEEDLFEKIKFVFNLQKNEIEKIQNQAHQTIVKNFSIESHVNNLYKIYFLYS